MVRAGYAWHYKNIAQARLSNIEIKLNFKKGFGQLLMPSLRGYTDSTKSLNKNNHNISHNTKEQYLMVLLFIFNVKIHLNIILWL